MLGLFNLQQFYYYFKQYVDLLEQMIKNTMKKLSDETEIDESLFIAAYKTFTVLTILDHTRVSVMMAQSFELLFCSIRTNPACSPTRDAAEICVVDLILRKKWTKWAA